MPAGAALLPASSCMCHFADHRTTLVTARDPLQCSGCVWESPKAEWRSPVLHLRMDLPALWVAITDLKIGFSKGTVFPWVICFQTAVVRVPLHWVVTGEGLILAQHPIGLSCPPHTHPNRLNCGFPGLSCWPVRPKH